MDSKALFSLTNGMYIVCSKNGDKFNGQVADVVFQASADPATIVACINKKNLTHDYIVASRVFSVSVLSEQTPLELIGHFGFKSGRDFNKFTNSKYSHHIGVTGVPVITDNVIAYMEAELVNQVDVNTHTLFIGRIVAAEVLSDALPMTYSHYHSGKKGVTPPNAPTYVKEDKSVISQKEDKTMKKYRCTVCGYIYDPEKGDPDSNVAPGTPFEKIPDTWVCPVCGVDKSMFEEI